MLYENAQKILHKTFLKKIDNNFRKKYFGQDWTIIETVREDYGYLPARYLWLPVT